MVDPFPPVISSPVMLYPASASRGTVVVPTDGGRSGTCGQHELKKSLPRNDQASFRVRVSREGFTMVPSYSLVVYLLKMAWFLVFVPFRELTKSLHSRKKERQAQTD